MGVRNDSILNFSSKGGWREKKETSWIKDGHLRKREREGEREQERERERERVRYGKAEKQLELKKMFVIQTQRNGIVLHRF